MKMHQTVLRTLSLCLFLLAATQISRAQDYANASLTFNDFGVSNGGYALNAPISFSTTYTENGITWTLASLASNFTATAGNNGTAMYFSQQNGIFKITFSKPVKIFSFWLDTNSAGTGNLKISIDADGSISSGDLTDGNKTKTVTQTSINSVVSLTDLTNENINVIQFTADAGFYTIVVDNIAYYDADYHTEIVWTGNSSSDWSFFNNWVPSQVPTANDNVTIPDNLSNYPVVASVTNASCNNLTIAPGATLSVEGSLTVGGTLIDSSDATGTGSVIVSGTLTTDSVDIERSIFDTNWYIISSPVAGTKLSTFAALFAEEKSSRYALAPYNEATDAWAYISTTPSTDEFEAGRGYTLKPNASIPRVHFGGSAVVSGQKDVTLSRTNFGWNAVGNPYLSSIRANGTNSFASFNSAKLDDSYSGLYFWNHSNADYDIVPSAGSGVNIPVGQGFIIKAKNNGDVVSFTSAMQEHAVATVFKSANVDIPEILLQVETSIYKNSTKLLFPEGATSGLDVGWDVGKLKGNPNIALYTKLVDADNGIDFAIQALPENYGELVVPIGIDVSAETEVTFTALAANLPGDASVWLEDRSAKTITQLDVADAKYTVTITDKTKGTGNFFLHTSSATTAVNELENTLQVYTHDRAIYISGNLESTDMVSVVGIDGKLHFKNRAARTGLLRIDATKMPEGVYLVNISGKTERVTKKVVITE